MYAELQKNHLVKLALPFLSSLDQGPVYLVGGSIRDAILGIPLHDLDFIIAGDVFSAARKLADHIHGAFYILDKERRYARVIILDEKGERFYFDFAPIFQNDLDYDLRSRDFTINAIAWDITSSDDTLIDPCCGVSDLEQKVLRPCSSAAFLDDPVRVIRSVRFAVGYGLEIPTQVKELIKNATPELEQVSAERKRDELFKILENNRVSQAMEMLRELGILNSLLPEAATLIGFSQSAPHQLDGWQHTLAAVTYCEAMADCVEGTVNSTEFPQLLQDVVQLINERKTDLLTVFTAGHVLERSQRALFLLAALNHDIGKPLDTEVILDGRKKYPHHAGLGAEVMENRARGLALSRKEVQWLERFVASHMLLHEIDLAGDTVEQNRQVFRFFNQAGQTSLFTALFSLADLLATYGETISAERWHLGMERCRLVLESWFDHYEILVNPQPFLNGDDLQMQFGMSPGKQMGIIIENMREEQAAGVIRSRADAEKWVKNFLEKKE